MQADVTAPDWIRKLSEAVNNFATGLLGYALAAAAIGTVTMALLEFLKALFFARRFYHKRRVRRWLAAASRSGDEKIYAQLLALTVGGEKNSGALFDQPTDKMMGQIQAAASVALEFPDTYKDLYDFLTAPPREEARSFANDATSWEQFSQKLDQGAGIGQAGNAGEATEEARKAARARARLDHLVARKLDAFQVATEFWWARTNQFLALAGGTALALYLFTKIQDTVPDLNLFERSVLSLLAGLVAPIAKDLVEALSGLRARVEK